VSLNLRGSLLGLNNHIFREEVDPVLKVRHDSIGCTPLSLTVRGVAVSVTPHLIVKGNEEGIISWVVKRGDVWLLKEGFRQDLSEDLRGHMFFEVSLENLELRVTLLVISCSFIYLV